VNEAYLKLAGQVRESWKNRAHFLAIAARSMRQILVDHARRKKAEKRGGAWRRTTLGDKELAAEMTGDELLALDDALSALAQRQRQVVEFKFFGGMTEEDIAEVLGISARSVQRDWVKARAWLYRELYPGDE
jgi:RNA polymerase sigma factor (TIGR02999 family)